MATKSGVGTAFIGRRAAENAMQAVRYTRDQGRPINTFVTISLITLGYDAGAADSLALRLLERMARWWRYQRVDKRRDIGPFTIIYAHANPVGRRHVHWMMHIPDHLKADFEAALLKRLLKMTKLDDVGSALQIKPAGGPGQLAKYILRGIDPAYGAYLHIVPEDEGTVTCRRTGTSRCIGKTARKAANWNRKARAA